MFDLDGTLIDSIPAYYKVLTSILEVVGLPPPPKALVDDFMIQGLPAFDKMIPEQMQERKEELLREFLTLGRSMLRHTFQEEVNLIPGVEELFSAITHRKIPIGIVSSTHRAYIDLKLGPLARTGLKAAVSSVIGIEDAPQKKPAPDPLLECARQLSVSPERCVYIGDSKVDIQSGRKAGMMTIGVLTGLHDRQTLERENPTMILDSVSELIPIFANNFI